MKGRDKGDGVGMMYCECHRKESLRRAKECDNWWERLVGGWGGRRDWR